MKKIYFVVYGALFSLNDVDARKLALDAMEGGGFDLSDYKSCKRIKFRELNDRSISDIRYGKGYITVNHCLDWQTEDWKEFLESF